MISTKDYIDVLHRRVKQMLEDKLPEQEIIELLVKEGVESHYAQMVIGNVQNDLHDRKAFYKLIVAGIVCLATSAFVWFYPDFAHFRRGLIYCFLLLAPLIGGCTFLYRAYSIFKQ